MGVAYFMDVPSHCHETKRLIGIRRKRIRVDVNKDYSRKNYYANYSTSDIRFWEFPIQVLWLKSPVHGNFSAIRILYSLVPDQTDRLNMSLVACHAAPDYMYDGV